MKAGMMQNVEVELEQHSVNSLIQNKLGLRERVYKKYLRDLSGRTGFKKGRRLTKN
jgi:hypothetical protein